MSSFKNESSFLFLLCSLDYLGLVKIHSLVRGWKYFPPGSKVLIFFNTQLCQSAEGVKGESSPSTAWLYLPINVMPFLHLISLCDHQSYRTGTAPSLPIRTHWRHQETLKQSPGWMPGLWIGPKMWQPVPLIFIYFWKKIALLRDDWFNISCSIFLCEN